MSIETLKPPKPATDNSYMKNVIQFPQEYDPLEGTYVTGYGKISHFVTREINRTRHFAMLP